MTLAELAEEYDHALQLIKDRLRELKQDPERNAVRIRDLEAMARSTREIRDVCRDYYKKECRINGAYTVRYTLQRTSRGVSAVAAGDRGDERGVVVPRKKKSSHSDSRGIDTAAAGDLASAFLLWGLGQRSGPSTKRRAVNRNQNQTESAEEPR